MGMEIPVLNTEMTRNLTDISVFVQLKRLFAWELKIRWTTSELSGAHTGHLMKLMAQKSFPSSRWVPAGSDTCLRKPEGKTQPIIRLLGSICWTAIHHEFQKCFHSLYTFRFCLETQVLFLDWRLHNNVWMHYSGILYQNCLEIKSCFYWDIKPMKLSLPKLYWLK